MLVDHYSVNAPHVRDSPDYHEADFEYTRPVIDVAGDGKAKVTLRNEAYTFRTAKKVGRVGAMMVGWGGNNGSTVTAGILSNKNKLEWNTKQGVQKADYLGSFVYSSTVRVGATLGDQDVYVPFNSILPMMHPNDLVIGGWDICKDNLAVAMRKAQVLDFDLQRQVAPEMQKLTPLPAVLYPGFNAENQRKRANNILPGSSKEDHLNKIRQNIRDFKKDNDLDTVIILWTASTERCVDIIPGVNDTSTNLLDAIRTSHEEMSPSTLYAVAAILEGAPYINGSPQNTFVPGCVQLAEQHNIFIGGDDFKSGQTKFKSALVDFLVNAGIRPRSIASYNHLGNNDGKNLSEAAQFHSKKVSKSNVVDDMVRSNEILYPTEADHPDHVVVIKYVPHVGDSKRAMDEYCSDIFMGGKNTIVTHNTCEDSLLAAPLIIDLIALCELFTRISYKTGANGAFVRFHPVLSFLSYLLKAPAVPPGMPVVNSLFKQRACIENLLRVAAGLPTENDLRLEHRALFIEACENGTHSSSLLTNQRSIAKYNKSRLYTTLLIRLHHSWETIRRMNSLDLDEMDGFGAKAPNSGAILVDSRLVQFVQTKNSYNLSLILGPPNRASDESYGQLCLVKLSC